MPAPAAKVHHDKAHAAAHAVAKKFAGKHAPKPKPVTHGFHLTGTIGSKTKSEDASDGKDFYDLVEKVNVTATAHYGKW